MLFCRGRHTENKFMNSLLSAGRHVFLPICFLTPSRKCQKSRRRVSLCRLRASLTVEAALILPFFFFCLISIISMDDFYGQYVRQQVNLQEKAEEASVAAIASGDRGLVIDLPVPAKARARGIPSIVPSARVACRGRVHAWTGRDERLNTGENTEEDDPLVYVTEHESVYHTRSECSYLSLSVHAVPASQIGRYRNSSGHRYRACDKCVGKGGVGGIIYISDDGTCYHNSSTCGGLTRHVRMVHRSEVENLHECTRCAAHAEKDHDGG